MTDEYTVPLIDSETGDGWDETVKASDPREAIQQATEQADGEPYVASTFVRKHGLAPPRGEL